MSAPVVQVMQNAWKVELQDNTVYVTYVTAASPATVPIAAIAFAIGGRPLEGEHIVGPVLVDPLTMLEDLPASQAYCDTTPTADATFLILDKDGAQVGSITFAAGQHTGTFVFNDELDLVAGDKLDLEAPTPRDDTLADVSITLRGVR